LGGANKSTQFHGPSFPQPDDIDEPAVADEAQQDHGTQAPVLEPVPIIQEQERTKQVSFGEVNDKVNKKSSKGAPSMMSRITSGSNKSRKNSNAARSDAGESFVTAKETLSEQSTQNQIRPNDSGNSTSSLLHKSTGDTETERTNSEHVNEAASPSDVGISQPLSPFRDDPTDTRHIGATNGDGTDRSAAIQHQSQSNGSELVDQKTITGLRQVNPISTGLVRFDIPEQPDSPDVQVDGATTSRSLKDLLKPSAEPGELVKAERMLVRIDWTKHDLPDNYTENDSLKAETKAVDKWREFIVVCRKSTQDEKSDYVLQMTKTRVILAKDRNHTRKSVAHEVPLQRNKTKISMFSSLDKTIAIWVPWKSGTRTYILRPSSSASSVEWFTFLNTILGWKRANVLTIHVPDLNVTLELANPFRTLESAQDKASTIDGSDPQESLTKLVEGVVARDIVERCMEMLKNSMVADVVDTWSSHDIKIGLAWKRYDRLEWVHGANEARMYGSIAMQRTHDLELRPKQHYPTHAISKKKHKQNLEEPAPVEGFLVRLTSQKGRHTRMGKTFFKRLYFSTHNHLLCFCLPGKAMPPKAPKMLKRSNSNVPKASELAEKIPLIFSVDPFPLQHGKIEWLQGATAGSTKKERDQYAYEENERKIQNLHDAQGYINLTHIVKVRKSDHRAATSDEVDQEAARDSADEETDDEEAADGQAEQERTFEITLRNGLVVRLQAYDKLARKEWVKRLRKLVKYWKLRAASDMELYKIVRNQNLESLDIDEEQEAILGQFAEKWEVAKSFASSELFNMCGISCCRAITMVGVLYRKPRLHSTFERCSVVLCHGKLLIFQSTLRKQSGQEIPHIHHERQELVELKDTYVYSGLVGSYPSCLLHTSNICR
jgi:hypothetical protein